MTGVRAGLTGFLAAASIAASSGCGPGAEGPDRGQPPGPVASPAEVRGEAPSAETFQAVVEAVLPALVYIQAEARPAALYGGFFGRSQPRGDLQPVGVGSGFLYSPDGLILTNNHVVQEAERVTVTMYDRRQFEARVVARDPATDVAVVQIEGQGFPAARLGDSDALHLGDWVLALGSPLGLEFTVTAGIVSGTGRALGILSQNRALGDGQAAPLEHFIQTDAAINPGNSGGPLVNLAGEVVGINTAIASPTGVFAGYGFAIPSNLARIVADQLVAHGEVRRPYLGVLLDDVSAADAEVYRLERPEGAEIKYVEPGGPAEAAGLQLGDVIVAVGDRAVRTMADLQAALALAPAGGATQLTVTRYGETLSVAVRMGVIRSGVVPQPGTQPAPGSLGFAVTEFRGRVVVARVEPFSAAARAGVRNGQILVAANRRAVGSVQELERALRDAPGTVISLVVEDPNLGRTILNYRP